MPIFAINRRTTEDRILYVNAETLGEAMRKARDGKVENTSDGEHVKSTFRFIEAAHE